MRYQIEQCAIVVLAAGMSSRLGSPKQSLHFKGQTLLQHAVGCALQTDIEPVVVVVGAHGNTLKEQMEGMKVSVVENEGWEEGMASSIRCGLTNVQKIKPDIDGIIFMVCDQPYVTGSLLSNLLTLQHRTGLPIVASSYGNSLGTPALFHKIFFAELVELEGETGAKKLIRLHKNRVATVKFPKGVIDIDTGTDYERLLQ